MTLSFPGSRLLKVKKAVDKIPFIVKVHTGGENMQGSAILSCRPNDGQSTYKGVRIDLEESGSFTFRLETKGGVNWSPEEIGNVGDICQGLTKIFSCSVPETKLNHLTPEQTPKRPKGELEFKDWLFAIVNRLGPHARRGQTERGEDVSEIVFVHPDWHAWLTDSFRLIYLLS